MQMLFKSQYVRKYINYFFLLQFYFDIYSSKNDAVIKNITMSLL